MTDRKQSSFDPNFRAFFSILTPVYNPSITDFIDCVRSVRNQSYPLWEWCLVDDCSTDRRIWPLLKLIALRDKRIKIQRRSENGGISAASNDALAMASGTFVALLDNDDELAPNALASVNHQLALQPDIGYLYSDEDKIDDEGRHFGRFNKPDWSPERLLCQNYCNHFSVIDIDLVREVGGYRADFDGAQDHDLLLRIAELDPKVVHIPEVLYHWRATAGSTALDVSEKPAAVDAGRRAIASAVERREINGTVVRAGEIYHRVHRHPTSYPKVSIIVPTRGTEGSVWGMRRPFSLNLLESLQDRNTYPNLEVIIVADTGTPESAILLEHSDFEINTIWFDEPFNFARKCNLGAIRAKGDVLIFLNDDIEPRSTDWIEVLTAHLEQDDVGAVGPMLLFDNHLVQSAGHINPGPGHFARGISPTAPVAGGWPLLLNREVSGLTGACLAMKRDVFFEVGGFCDELPLNYNDVDLGFKLQQEGYRLIWTPDASLYHFESKSRETDLSEVELDFLERHWGRLIAAGKVDRYVR